jgi:hypothetical protein
MLPVAPGALGIIESPDKTDASWIFEAPLVAVPPGVSDAYALKSASNGAFGGQYLTFSKQNNAPCDFPPPAGDAMLTADFAGDPSRATWIIGPLPPANVSSFTVNPAVVTNPAVNRKFMGVRRGDVEGGGSEEAAHGPALC